MIDRSGQRSTKSPCATVILFSKASSALLKATAIVLLSCLWQLPPYAFKRDVCPAPFPTWCYEQWECYVLVYPWSRSLEKKNCSALDMHFQVCEPHHPCMPITCASLHDLVHIQVTKHAYVLCLWTSPCTRQMILLHCRLSGTCSHRKPGPQANSQRLARTLWGNSNSPL